jgi:hypothetical protein
MSTLEDEMILVERGIMCLEGSPQAYYPGDYFNCQGVFPRPKEEQGT